MEGFVRNIKEKNDNENQTNILNPASVSEPTKHSQNPNPFRFDNVENSAYPLVSLSQLRNDEMDLDEQRKKIDSILQLQMQLMVEQLIRENETKYLNDHQISPPTNAQAGIRPVPPRRTGTESFVYPETSSTSVEYPYPIPITNANTTSFPSDFSSIDDKKQTKDKFTFILSKTSKDLKKKRDKFLNEQKPQKHFDVEIKKQWHIEPDDLECIAVVGSGYYGEVWRGKWKGYKGEVALKTFKSSKMSRNEFYAEAISMMRLRHPNLVKLFGVSMKTKRPFLVMQFHKFGSLLDYFKAGKMINSKELKTLGYQVASGMDYLGEQGFIHRDLCARNVLIDNELQAKITDFGLACIAKDINRKVKDNMKMPWKWTAPEALQDSPRWSIYSDIWSFGVFLWEIFSDCVHPYQNIMSRKSMIQFLGSSYRLQRPLKCETPIYQDIILKCWVLKPEERISFKVVKILFQSKM